MPMRTIQLGRAVCIGVNDQSRTIMLASVQRTERSDWVAVGRHIGDNSSPLVSD